MHMCRFFVLSVICCLMIFHITFADENHQNLEKRRVFLDQLLENIPPDPVNHYPVTPLDTTWRDWLQRTGELPPDFDSMPSLPFLPNPLILDEGGKNILLLPRNNGSKNESG